MTSENVPPDDEETILDLFPDAVAAERTADLATGDLDTDDDPTDAGLSTDGATTKGKKLAAWATWYVTVFGTTFVGHKYGLPTFASVSATLIVVSAFAVTVRAGIHIRKQHKLSSPDPDLRRLAWADLPVVAGWWYAAFLAVSDYEHSAFPLVLALAGPALAVLAALQDMAAARAGEPTGTDWVAEHKIPGLTITFEKLGHSVANIGEFFDGRHRERKYSVLVAILLTFGMSMSLHAIADRAGRLGGTRSTRSTNGGEHGSSNEHPPPGPRPKRSTSTSAHKPKRSDSSKGHIPNSGKDAYDHDCNGKGMEPGQGAPRWASDLLNKAWFGPGARPAGCAQQVHLVSDGKCPTAWQAGVDYRGSGQIVSVAIANKCRPDGAIYLDNSALPVLNMLADNIPVSGSCRQVVNQGDLQLVSGPFGTIALAREDRSDDDDTLIVPPAITTAWKQISSSVGALVWPTAVSTTTFEFDDLNGVVAGTAHIPYTSSPQLATTGTVTIGHATYSVTAHPETVSALTPGVPAVCH